MQAPGSKNVVASHVRSHAVSATTAVTRIRSGLHVREFDTLREFLGLTVESMAAKIGISVATLSRRRRKHEPLDAAHSDRVMRYARLFRLATELHDGDEAAARAWLVSPARALDGETPLNFADTEAGAREVEQLIGRLEFGVYP
jgi:putative toxin-antitoxin system antitoxin component (TIGR02293 family)